jgi:hypothetical protein
MVEHSSEYNVYLIIEWWNQLMARGLAIPFPRPSGLTQNDLKRLYDFAANRPDAQISVLVGGSRRTSALLALADHYLWTERDAEAVLVRESFGQFPADPATSSGDLLSTVRAVLSAEDEPPQSQAALVG